MLIGFAVFQSLVTIIILSILNIQFFRKFNEMGLAAHLPPDHIYFHFLLQQKAYFGKAIGVVFVLISFFLVASVTLLSHRIAGPLYRLNQHMKAIAAGGPLKFVYFRTRDFFPELAENFNQMATKLNEEKKGNVSENSQS